MCSNPRCIAQLIQQNVCIQSNDKPEADEFNEDFLSVCSSSAPHWNVSALEENFSYLPDAPLVFSIKQMDQQAQSEEAQQTTQSESELSSQL
jgi:hypothetical protein